MKATILRASCGWCGVLLHEGAVTREGKESTGICPACAAEHFPTPDPLTLGQLANALETRGYVLSALGERVILGTRQLDDQTSHEILFHRAGMTDAWIGSAHRRRLIDVMETADAVMPVYETKPLAQSGWLETFAAAHQWLMDVTTELGL